MATALRVVSDQDYDPDDVVVVSAHAAATGGGGLDLEAGDAYTAGELLYALLLSSSNDASVALAEYSAGEEQPFVAGMNRLADRLGASSTRFVTPHGLDAPGHYSTARDLAVLGEATLDDPVLAPIVETPRITVAGPRGPELVENRNLLLETYRGAIGVKTGFTAGAGNVLVGAAIRHERRIVAVAMRSDDAAADARRLLDYGFHRLSRSVIVARGQTVGELVLDSGGSTLAVARRAVRGWARPEDVRLEFLPAATITMPVAPGEPVGEVELQGASGYVAAVPAAATEAVSSDDSSWMQTAFATALRWGYETAAMAGAGEP